MKNSILILITALLAVACNRGGGDNAEKQHTIVYGIIADDYNLERGQVNNGQCKSLTFQFFRKFHSLLPPGSSHDSCSIKLVTRFRKSFASSYKPCP